MKAVVLRGLVLLALGGCDDASPLSGNWSNANCGPNDVYMNITSSQVTFTAGGTTITRAKASFKETERAAYLYYPNTDGRMLMLAFQKPLQERRIVQVVAGIDRAGNTSEM